MNRSILCNRKVIGKLTEKLLETDISSIYIEETRTKFCYFILTNIRLKAIGLGLNLSVYQICCNILPREQGVNVCQIF